MKYLLDANTWINHLRHGPNSKVTARLASIPPGGVFLCSIVLGELLCGANHSGSLHQSNNLALIASPRQQFASLAFDDKAAEEYGKIREYVASLGQPIGPNDLLIACIGLANGLTVVTHNMTEFSRVPGLIVDDWQ